MALPANYDGKHLSPTVIISNLDDTEQFRFESKVIDAVPEQDFNLSALGLHAGLNDDHGNALLLIDDSNNIFTNNDVRRASKVKNQWNLKIQLGKGVTGDTWFQGKILRSDIIRSRTGQQFIKLISAGWGIRTMDRISTIERIQKRTGGGIDYDSTDNLTDVNSLVNDIFEDQDHYILRSLGLESDITLTGIETNTTQLTEFKDYYQSWSFIVSRLAAVAGSVWGIDANKDVFFRNPKSNSSGLLFSGDTAGVVTQKWTPSKIGYIIGPVEWTDGVGDSGYSVLHAPGATTDSLDVNENPTVNADFNLSSNWLAIEWTTAQDTLSKIAAKFKKVGTPADGDAFFQIVGEATGGGPKMADLRKKVRIPLQTVLRFSSSNPDYFSEYSFEKIKVTPEEKLYLVFEKYGTASHHYVLQYASGGANNYYTSSDGVSWALSNGDFALRTYPTRTLNVILYNTSAARRYGVREKVIDVKNIADIQSIRKVMLGLSDIMSREKRVYKPLTVTVPDNYFTPGQTARIIDTYGLNTDAIITGWDIAMSAGDPNSHIGANRMTVTLEDFY